MKAREANRNYELNYNGEIDNGILINHNQNDKSIDDSSDRGSLLFNSEESYFGNQVQEISKNNLNSLNEIVFSNDPLQNRNFQVKNNFNSNQTFVVDENLVKIIEELGYHRDFLIKSLYSNELNYATTLYFLLNLPKIDY